MTKDKKSFWDEEEDKIKRLEALTNFMYRSKMMVDENGERIPKMTTTELRDLAAVEEQIIKMKRRRYGFS